MSIVLDGSLGITSPAETVQGNLTTTGNTILGDASTDTLNVGNGGLVKDASGNVGIGVTPSAWGASMCAVEAGAWTALVGSTAASSGYTRLMNSSYYNGTNFIYKGTGTSYVPAQYVMTSSGAHEWYTAPSGTAGNAITFTQAMTLNASGNLLVGTPSGSARANIKGSTTDGSTYSIRVANSADADLFQVRTDGLYQTGTLSLSPYNYTTGSAANMFVSAGGSVQRSTSSLKYKNSVETTAKGLSDVLKLRAVTYKGNNDGDIIFGGLIAEEVHEAGLTEFVQYAEDGSPDALAYGHMVSLAFKAIQELNAKFEEYKASHP
jgi:hypothetical protein